MVFSILPSNLIVRQAHAANPGLKKWYILPVGLLVMVFEQFIRYTGLAVGLMVFEQFIRYASLAVGLKPSATGCEARLCGLYQMMYSKTISPRLRNAKPACAGYAG